MWKGGKSDGAWGPVSSLEGHAINNKNLTSFCTGQEKNRRACTVSLSYLLSDKKYDANKYKKYIGKEEEKNKERTKERMKERKIVYFLNNYHDT